MSLTIRLKSDQIVLKLGSETHILEVRDGVCDEASYLVLTLQSRIQEVLKKRRLVQAEQFKNDLKVERAEKKQQEKDQKEWDRYMVEALGAEVYVEIQTESG